MATPALQIPTPPKASAFRSGVYYDLPYAVYDAIKAVRWTALKAMDVSPAHYRYALRHPREDTAALALGRATHTALLEPERFEDSYACWRGGIRRGAEWEAFKADNAHREGILTVDEWNECLDMALAVRRNRDARRYVTAGRSEVTIVWTDPVTGLRCKARIDRLSRHWYINAKTAKTIDARRFGYQAADLGYHAGLAFTLGGLEALGLHDRAAKLVVVDKSDEHDCVVFDVAGDKLAAGEATVGRLLGKLAQCKRTRSWPGRYQGEQELLLPAHALAEELDVSSLGIDFGD